jgi:transposase
VSFELSLKSWGLTFGNGARITRRVVGGGDFAGVLEALKWAKQRLKLAADCEVLSCYEAGRDGFHLHRWLEAQGIKNLVVDSSSIEVDRRARRAKTDRVDGLKLLELLMGYWREAKKLAVVRVPSEQQEDERRVHRERGRLEKEVTAHRNRIRGLLFAQGVRVNSIGGRGWAQRVQKMELGEYLKAELEREGARLALVQTQLKTLESSRAKRLADKQSKDVAIGLVKQLLRLYAVGINSAWVLVKEFFAWREFRNRRELGALSGLVPTPYNSGNQVREQGISKAGNRRVRALLIELAWQWLRHQPQSALAQWFNARFAAGGSRTRRIGIVALARKLLVALWRYLQHAELPAGARMKAPA